jgi:hypothetical protein
VVRIPFPPAESQQTFGACSRAPPAPRRIELTTARDASISAISAWRCTGVPRPVLCFLFMSTADHLICGFG